MGNIISNTSNIQGTSSGTLGLGGGITNSDGSVNSFVQNMTDILLELNLFNTGQYNVANDTSKNGPRSEFDYSSNAYKVNPTVGSIPNDQNTGVGRPINANGKYIDILGIPYTTNEVPIPGGSNSTSAIVQPEYSKTITENNSFYNMKRSVCNQSNKIPISIVGVDLPADDPDLTEWVSKNNSGNIKYLPNILSNQKNQTYAIPASGIPAGATPLSDMVNNCLTFGTTTANTQTLPSIPDLTPNSGLTLNDYSNTPINSAIPHNIYDQPLSKDCVALLDSMVIDSFTTPNIKNYSKWTPGDVAALGGITTGASSLVHDYVANKVGVVPLIGKSTLTSANIPAGFTLANTNLFGQGSVSTLASGGIAAQADMNESCNQFEKDLCSWYYYYDIQDGMKANVNSPLLGGDASKYINNLQYLSSHVPDCRCSAFLNTNGGSSAALPAAATNAFDAFYFSAKCNANYTYGQMEDANGKTYPSNQFSVANNSVPIYNAAGNTNNYIAYRRQFDPTGSQLPGTTDNIWGFVANNNRTRALTINNYTCNMKIENNITGTGGNVVIGGISMTCGLPQPCDGGWVNATGAKCNAKCNADGTGGNGTINQVYKINSPAANGGKECPNKEGETQLAPCTGTACPPVDCVGSWDTNWSACSGECNQSGIQTKQWTVTTAAKYGGACPSGPQTQPCVGVCPAGPTNCVGHWTPTSSCVAPGCGQIGSYIQTYTIDTQSAKGGTPCSNITGDTRTQVCQAEACTPKNCVGNWITTSGAKCSSSGTISQTWSTITQPSAGGTACPSTTRTAPCSTNSPVVANGNLDPKFTGIYFVDPTQTTLSYTIPLSSTTPILLPNTTLSAALTVNTAIVETFTSNYDFVLFLVSDPSKVITCPKYSGSTCPVTTNGGNVSGSCSPYIITLPFIYGSSNQPDNYQLGIRNKPNNFTNTINPQRYSIPIRMIQYTMSISETIVSIISGNTYFAIKIDLNTTDKIDSLPVRIILTPVSGTSTPLTKYYPDLLSTLASNNNMITIGGGDSNKIQPIAYTYKVMINETIGNTTSATYSGGYQMNYEQTFPITKQGNVDFSKIISTFNNVLVQYIDYNNNNVVCNVATNDTLLVGSTILFSWLFNCVDPGLTSIKIYYDTNPNYVPSSTASSTSVLLQSSSLGTLDTATNNYSSTINFICPFLQTTQPVIFYAIASGSSTSIYSTTIQVSLPQFLSIPNVNNWPIVTNSTSSDMTTLPATALTPVLSANQTIATIDNYFTAGKTFKYIIYNPDNASWYGSNATPVAVTTATSAVPKYTIFQSPFTGVQPVITVVSIISNKNTIYSSSTIGTIILELGAELTLNYQITNITSDTNFQLILANKTITRFAFKKGSPSAGSITFTVFGDVTVTNPGLVLTSYGTFSSSAIPIKLNNMGAFRKIMSSATSVPASTATLSNVTNPAISIAAPNNDNLISNLNVSYAPMPENQYFTQLTSFGSPLSISNLLLTFGKMDFILPFSYIFHSSLTEGFQEYKETKESFTNATQIYLESKQPKKFPKLTDKKQKTHINSNIIESYTEHLSNTSNTLSIDTLSLDFSFSILETMNSIQLMFSGYTSVSILNLQLIFGNLSLDNKKFNISVISNTTTKTTFNIPTITFIGSLSSKLFISSSVFGSPTVNYSVNKMIGNNYALIRPLIYSNGYYNLPPNYQANLDSVLNPPVNNKPIVKPIIAPTLIKSPSGSEPGFLDNLAVGTGIPVPAIIAIFVAILGIIGYLIYSIMTMKTKIKF